MILETARDHTLFIKMHAFSAISISIVSIKALSKVLGDISHCHLEIKMADVSGWWTVEHESDSLSNPLYILNSSIVERILKFI